MERIIGMPMPSIRMPSSDGGELDIAQLVTSSAIVYLYPGDGPPPGAAAQGAATDGRTSQREATGRRTPQGAATGRRIAAMIGADAGRLAGAAQAPPTSCAVQRASFREYALDFAAHGAKVIGVSSEPHETQRAIALAERLPFPLLSDVACSLADALSLPTVVEGEIRRYRRATLICKQGGVVGAVFYPVSPKRSAMQALAWLERSSS